MSEHPDRRRLGAAEAGMRQTPSALPDDRTRLRAMLDADSLDDLVRVACRESDGLGIDRLFIVGWYAQQLGPWAIFPHSSTDRVLSSAVEQKLNLGRNLIAPDASEDVLLGEAAALGFDGMAIVTSQRPLVFHVFWSSVPSQSPPNFLGSAVWSDLEVALCNFARLEQVRELSHIDTLTNVFNRRYFNHRLTEEVARAARFSRPLALAICDLDRFKILNDSHGHQAGDVILRYIAQALRRSVRAIDIVCRLGGDEFAVLMPDTDAEECGLLSERLRQSVASGGFTLGGRESGGEAVDLRLSLGVAVFPRHADRAERLLWCADMALLEAKRNGGNSFVICDPSKIRRGTAL
jgi:diguanylate cyclase (GGDEF)-like protein